MSDKPADWRSHAAFWLSIANAAFAGYQFYHSQIAEKKNKAIEITEDYLKSRSFYGDFATVMNYPVVSMINTKPEEDAKIGPFLNTLAYAEYVASLANRNEIDSGSLGREIVCLIELSQTVRPKDTSKTWIAGWSYPQLDAFAKEHKQECDFAKLPTSK